MNTLFHYSITSVFFLFVNPIYLLSSWIIFNFTYNTIENFDFIMNQLDEYGWNMFICSYHLPHRVHFLALEPVNVKELLPNSFYASLEPQKNMYIYCQVFKRNNLLRVRMFRNESKPFRLCNTVIKKNGNFLRICMKLVITYI